VRKKGSRELSFTLHNVGDGPGVVDAETLATDSEYVLAVLLGSHYCPASRALVKALADADERFRERSTAVVPVLPDVRERARLWDDQYDPPFPLLVDPEDGDGDGDGFEAFGPLRDELGDLPGVGLFADAGGRLVVVDSWSVEGDPPSVESLLARLDAHLEEGGTHKEE
jgi:peroxiredoxin Q/BCP